MPRPCNPTLLSIAEVNAMVRRTWPAYETFDMATYFVWPGPACYLYPNVSATLAPDGVVTPAQLLQALVAKHVLRATSYVLLVTEHDLSSPTPDT